MNKLNPIKYIESMLSHHPKSFYLWITDGIVIDGKRYIIKEFRFRNGKLYAVIAENKYNPKYFEVQLCPDEETLKAIYKAIEDNKVAIKKEVTDRTNEITRVDAAIKANTTKINQEITDRTNEINRVDAAVKENTAKINKEIADRTSEIARVDEAINANTTKINQEITDRTSEISRVDSAINKEITDRTGEISRVDSAIKANTTKIEQETTDRQNEITRVDNAINANTAKIDKEITDRTNEITRLDKALKDNKGSIDQDIARIDNAINENTTKINQEITNRKNEINRVDEAINSNTTKINQEITDRKSEITRVNSAIESNTTNINKEITDRTSEVARLDKTIKDNKAAADQTAEGLNTRIESLETYKEGEQTRANQYFESAKAETTRQLTAERTANADTYVTKATHTSDVNDIRNDLATTNATVETAISKADTAQATANTNTQTINTHTTQISALNNGLSAKVSQTDFNTLSGRVTTAENNITAKANELSSKITSVEGKLPSGEMNLVEYGRPADGYSPYAGAEYTTHEFYYNGAFKMYIIRNKATSEKTLSMNRFKVERNTEYTLYFKGFNNSNVTNMDVWFLKRVNGSKNDWDSTQQLVGRKLSISKAGGVSVTFNTGNYDEGYLRFDNNGSTTAGTSADLYFGDVSVKKGKTNNGWSPSLAELASSQDLKSTQSELKQTKDGITLLATKTELNTAKNELQSGIKTATDKANTNAQTINALNSSLAQKQDKLTAGEGITIEGNVISSTGGGGDSTPQHDTQKEQVLESTRNTITIGHGANGTSETTKVDTDPAKVLEHSNLLTDYGVSKTTTGNTTKLGLEYTRVDGGYDLNNLLNGRVRSESFLNAPENGRWLFVSAFTENMYTIQEAVALVDTKNTTYRRTRQNGVWGAWREQVSDKSVIDAAISANTTKINQEITDRQNEITRVEGKIPTSLDSLNLMTGTRDWSTKANKWHMGEGWSTESEEYQGLKVHSTQKGWNGSHQNIFVKNGDVITFSFFAKATQPLNNVKVLTRFPGSPVYQAPSAGVKESDEEITVTNEWKRYSKTVHITSDGSLQFRTEYNDATTPNGNTFYVAGLKVAKSVLDTGYSENPTDTASDITKLNTTLTQTTNELNDKITSVDNKVCKTVNIDTTNYSGHYSISNGVVTQYKVVAKDGKYIDLENFTLSNGTDPLASARLDSRLLKVLFEYVDTQNKTLLTTSNALFTIDDQHKFVINKTQVTSALCAKNLSTVKSISLL